jgi:hypothetical protein
MQILISFTDNDIYQKKIDCNSSTQAIFNLQTFNRKEFKEVLDTLINESANNLRDFF